MVVCSSLCSFNGALPPGTLTAQHVALLVASLDSTSDTASSRATKVYLIASLQNLLTRMPHSRQRLLSAGIVARLLSAADSGQESQAQTDMLQETGDSCSRRPDIAIHAQAPHILTKTALWLLSQLIMQNGAADACVVQQVSHSHPKCMWLFILFIFEQTCCVDQRQNWTATFFTSKRDTSERCIAVYSTHHVCCNTSCLCRCRMRSQ